MSRARQLINDYDGSGELLRSLHVFGNRVNLPMTLKNGMQRTYKTGSWANTKKFLPLSVLPPAVHVVLMKVLTMDEEGQLRDHVEAAKKADKRKGPKTKGPMKKKYINIHALQSLCLLPTRMVYLMLKMMESHKQCAVDLPVRVKNATVEATLIEEVVLHLRMTLAGLAGSSQKEAEDATEEELLKMCPVYCHPNHLEGMRNHVTEQGKSCIPFKTKKDRLTIREHGKRLVLFSDELQTFFACCAEDLTSCYKVKKEAQAAEVAEAIRKAGLTPVERENEATTMAMVQRPQVAVALAPINELAFSNVQLVFHGNDKELVKLCAPHKQAIHLVFVNMYQEKTLDDLMALVGLMRDCAAENFTAIFLLPDGLVGEVMKKRVESTMKTFGKDMVTLHYNPKNTNHPIHPNTIGFYYKPAPAQLKPRVHTCTAIHRVGAREPNRPYPAWPFEVSANRRSGRN